LLFTITLSQFALQINDVRAKAGILANPGAKIRGPKTPILAAGSAQKANSGVKIQLPGAARGKKQVCIAGGG
jgi:hypothetical protein